MKKLFCFIALISRFATAADYANGQAARLVIGQVTFTDEYDGATNFQLGSASGVAWGANKLFVVDSNRFAAVPVNNRVLIFPTDILPKATDQVNVGLPTDDPHYNQLLCKVCARTTANVVLGQPDFNNNLINLTQNGFRVPTAVATDGVHLAVADTDNNRILIWNSIPTSINQNADVVVGQSDFVHNATANPPTAKSLRGPQGVWFQNGKLFVADTQDNRVLIYNQIPTAPGAAADVVLGVPNMTTAVPAAITVVAATASNLT